MTWVKGYARENGNTRTLNGDRHPSLTLAGLFPHGEVERQIIYLAKSETLFVQTGSLCKRNKL